MKNPFIESCPNCDSAWTGGHPNPKDITSCIVCNDKHGKMTGWVWSRLIDPFCWIGQWVVGRNMRNLPNTLG